MRFLRNWCLTVIITLIILWLTLARQPLPEGADIPLFENADKVVHAIMFGTLAVASFIDLRYQRKVLTNKLVCIVCFAVAIFACLDEWTQQFTGRTSDVADAIADVVGIALVAITVLLAKRLK